MSAARNLGKFARAQADLFKRVYLYRLDSAAAPTTFAEKAARKDTEVVVQLRRLPVEVPRSANVPLDTMNLGPTLEHVRQ